MNINVNSSQLTAALIAIIFTLGNVSVQYFSANYSERMKTMEDFKNSASIELVDMHRELDDIVNYWNIPSKNKTR